MFSGIKAMGALAGLVVIACAVPGTASAATLSVPADFDTIQDAVDAADPGDTVEVKARKASYLESVEIETEDLAVVGIKGRPVVDGFSPSSSPATVQVEADGVEVRNLTIINEEAYRCDANGCVVRDVVFRGIVSGDCVEIVGDDALVADTRMEACGNRGIDIEGADAQVLRNTANGIDADCIFVRGARPKIKGNTSIRCEDDQGVEVNDGDGAVVVGNKVLATDSGGFTIAGDDVVLRKNEAQLTDSHCYDLTGDDGVAKNNLAFDCDSGLRANGPGWTIRNNEISFIHDSACIRANDEGALVSGNHIQHCYKGIELQAEGEITGNRIEDVHTDDGIGLFCHDEVDDPNPPDTTACDEIRVTGNVVHRAGDDDSGIAVNIEEGTGTGAVISGNDVRDTFDDGIEAFIDDGFIEGNTVTRAGAEEEEGIEVFGTGNVIQNNVSTRNGGDGIAVRSDNDGSFGNVIAGNVVKKNNQDGIRTEGDADLVSENRATNNNGDGIEIDGNSVDVIDNFAARNRVDCATDGSVNANEGNSCADGSDFAVTSSGIPS